MQAMYPVVYLRLEKVCCVQWYADPVRLQVTSPAV
jgi:hypothetical protein